MTNHARTILARTLAATAVLALAATAMAQGGDPAAAPGVDHLALVALIAGAVAWYRATPVGQRIDVVLTVALFAMVAGGVVALALQVVGLLAFQPFHHLLGPIWGAAAAGIVAAIEAVFGVSITKYAASLFTKGADGKVTVQPGALVGLLPGAGGAPGVAAPTAVAFILDTAERILGRTPVGATLTSLLPLIQQYAQHPAVLTDDLRATIQGQVLRALDGLGAPGQDIV